MGCAVILPQVDAFEKSMYWSSKAAFWLALLPVSGPILVL
jgi:hypothetical protein